MRLFVTSSRSGNDVERAADRADDLRPVLRVLADDLRDREARVFREGRGWARLDPETVRRKGSSRLLVDRGVLLASLTRSGAGNVERITDDSVTVGTSIKVGGRRGGNLAKVLAGRGRDPVPRLTRGERQALTARVRDYMVGSR